MGGNAWRRVKSSRSYNMTVSEYVKHKTETIDREERNRDPCASFRSGRLEGGERTPFALCGKGRISDTDHILVVAGFAYDWSAV